MPGLHEEGGRLTQRNPLGASHVASLSVKKLFLATLPLLAVSVAIADDPDPAWKTKQIPEWSEQDAKDLLAESPWVKTFTPSMKQNQDGNNNGMGRRRGMGGGGVGMGGIGIGIPGMGGMGRRYPGGGYPGGGGGYPNDQQQNRRNDNNQPSKVTLRWESALPVRSAELKAHDNDAPTLDEKHYVVAVYGVPNNQLNGDAKKIADQLKGKASIKRDGKKDIKPSSVEVLDRPDGPVVVYAFPTTNEITSSDRRLEFDANIGRLELEQSFFTEEMTFQGKLEL